MEILEIEVTGKKALTLPWEEVQVMPIGDVQLGAHGVAEDRLRESIKWAMDQGNVYFIGMGDYIDVLSPSNRAAFQSAKLYDSARELMADAARGLTDRFLDLVDGTAGRWLGILEGHHYFEFDDGTTSDTVIAQRLTTTFLGTCAFVRMSFVRKNRTSMKCTIWAHHGAGNGLTPHSPLTRLYHVMHMFDADIYLMGHQTKRPVVKVPRLYMAEKPPYRIIARNKVLAGTGGYMEGYNEGSRVSGRAQGSYVEKALLAPSSLGSVLLKIRPVHDGNSGDRIDINVEI